MEKKGKSYQVLLPVDWTDVIVRAVVIFVIAFLAFHLKEYLDAGRVDTLDIAVDSLWVAGGAVVVYAILMMFRR